MCVMCGGGFLRGSVLDSLGPLVQGASQVPGPVGAGLFFFERATSQERRSRIAFFTPPFQQTRCGSRATAAYGHQWGTALSRTG